MSMSDPVLCMTFTADSGTLAAGSQSGQIRVRTFLNVFIPTFIV
jgi:hypothetical protein